MTDPIERAVAAAGHQGSSHERARRIATYAHNHAVRLMQVRLDAAEAALEQSHKAGNELRAEIGRLRAQLEEADTQPVLKRDSRGVLYTEQDRENHRKWFAQSAPEMDDGRKPPGWGHR